jgi:hypothetical protein
VLGARRWCLFNVREAGTEHAAINHDCSLG